MDSDDRLRHAMIAVALASGEPITVAIRDGLDSADKHVFFTLDRPIFACVVSPPGTVSGEYTMITADGSDEASIQRAVMAWVDREFPGCGRLAMVFRQA